MLIAKKVPNLFFSGDQNLRKIAEIARALAQGQEPPAFLTSKEPYFSLLSNIQILASRLEERSRSATEERNRILAILESMTEGVLVVDIEQKILLVNSTLADAFGFEKSAAAGRFFWEMFRDADINEMIQSALAKRQAARREHEATLSGSIFEIQVSPVSIGADFLGMVAVFRDITSLKQFDRLRSEFVANVSHELKTPLTSILGFVETLKEGALSDPENSLKFLSIIEEQSLKLNAMIEDLLLLSRLESSKEAIRLEPVKLATLFMKIGVFFAPRFKENNLSFSTEAPDGLTVMAESTSLERVLINLIDNAVKYNQKEGRILVRAWRDSEGVNISVNDTGSGIAPQDLGRIFERFYRADKSRSRETGGSGLGLSIAKHLIERHGGRIEVESTSQQGSTFTIILPGCD